jgi:hypothetical protein
MPRLSEGDPVQEGLSYAIRGKQLGVVRKEEIAMGTPRTPSAEVGIHDRLRCPNCLAMVPMIGPRNFFQHMTKQHPADPIAARIVAWLQHPDPDAQGRHERAG